LRHAERLPDLTACSRLTTLCPVPHRDRDDFYRRFGRAIRRARLDQNLTQADLGRPLDLSRASIANIEAGRQHCSLHAAVVLADTLDVPLTDLLPDADDAPLVLAELEPDLDRYRDDIALVLSRVASDTATAKDSAQ
jgi:DNA-binding XRE family transcriptional regulator